MKKAILFIASTLLYVVLGAQSVPDKMIFGNLKITIKPGAKVIMQENVDALTKSKPYFESIVERANTYFPIVEKRLKAVGVPDEIKYLCLQESSLIADAVSSSNAVGYWQFKKGTAEEVGLTVNRTIDERKNIVAASTGAAKYIKKHNKSLNNWGYALLSYYTGLGGVQKYVKKKYLGAKHMTIDQHTHWYLLKFLSHKIAFEHAIKKRSPKIALIENDKVGGKTIADLAKLYDVDKDEIKLYNRWIDFNKTIPKDKVYVAILPVAYDKKGVTQANENNVFAGANKLIDVIFGGEKVNLKELPSTFTVNGVKAIIPKSTDTYTDLAHQGGITLDELFAYNEMSSTTPVNKNTFYFLERKKKKALVNFHPAKEGETVHSISQLFGVRSSAILKKNRMKAASELKTGRVLWLRKTRSKKTPVKYGEVVIPKEENTPLQPKGLEKFPVFNGKSPDISQLPKPTAPEVIVPVIKKLPNSIETNKESISDTVLSQKIEEDLTPIETIDDPIFSMEEDDITKEMNEKAEIIEEGKEEVETNIVPLKNETEPETILSEAAIDTPTPPNKEKVETPLFTTHTVKKSETVYSISKQHNTTVKQLLEWNNLTNYNLSIGQELKIFDKKTRYIPAKIPAPTHKVIKGDTYYSISKKYNLTVEELKKANKKTDFSLSIGEEIIVK